MHMASPNYNIRLPPELRERLQVEADKRRWSLAQLLIVAAEEWLEKWEKA